jgi:hypothetical protein
MTISDSRLANLAARQAFGSWGALADRYRIITRRAGLRFAGQDWGAMSADHVSTCTAGLLLPLPKMSVS